MLFVKHGVDMMKKQDVAFRHLRTKIHLGSAARPLSRATPYLFVAEFVIAIELVLHTGHDDFADQGMRRPLFGEYKRGGNILPARYNQAHSDALGIFVHTNAPPQLEPAPAVQPKQ